MKKSLVIVITLVALGVVAGQALAARHASSPTAVTVAMHDPGCHWFLVGGKYMKSLSVKGPVSLVNVDEATLKIAGASGAKLDAVGKKVALARGTYRITMVGQAPDDNTLTLNVK
jgi:hypothetical protein